MKRAISILSLIALAFIFTSTNAEAKHESKVESFGCGGKNYCYSCGARYYEPSWCPEGNVCCTANHTRMCQSPDW